MASRLFVGNLPYEATEDEIRDHFAQVAPVARVFLPLDRDTGKPRGFAFVEFADSEHAATAIQQLNQKPFKDRPLVVNEARPSDGPRPSPGGFGRPPAFGSPTYSSRPPSRERTTIGGSSDSGVDGATPRRSAPSKPRRRGAGKRSFWEDGPKKAPIPEKRRSQIFGGYDDVEEDVESTEGDADFENFATGLPDSEDED